MPVPIVAVEIAEPRPEQSRELSVVLLAACNDALRQGQCVLLEEAREPSLAPNEAISAAARVAWSPGHARIEVWVAAGASIEKRARQLEFAETHPPIERWRSVGFVAGTLANPTNREASASPATEEPGASSGEPAARGTAPASAPPPGSREALDPPASDEQDRAEAVELSGAGKSRIWLDFGPTTGPGFNDSPWRLGGFLSLAYAVRSSFVQASFAYSAPPKDESGLAGRWLTAGVGAGYSLLDLPVGFSIKLRSELLLENTRVSLSTPEAPGNDSGSHWVGGLRLGGDVSWNAVPSLAVFLGGDLAAFTGRVHVDIGGSRTATTPAVRPSLLGGARLTFPVSGLNQRARAQR